MTTAHEQRYLVTGAQGFVGRYVVAELLRLTHSKVLGVGRSKSAPGYFTHRLASGLQAPVPAGFVRAEDCANYSYARSDLAELNSNAKLTGRLRDFQPTHVIHLASGLFGDEPQALFRTNVEGTLNLFSALGAAGLERRCKVVLSSSGGVYGATEQQPVNELTMPQPMHYYTASKLAAEYAATAAARDKALELCIARIFNVVGAGLDERHACAQWLSALHRLMQTDAQPRSMPAGDLTATRDFIDVRDVATGCCRIAAAGRAGDVYNLGSGVETPMSDVLVACRALADPEGSVAIVPNLARANDVPRNVADIAKLRSLNWQPRFRLGQSLRELHEYYRLQGTAEASACA